MSEVKELSKWELEDIAKTNKMRAGITELANIVNCMGSSDKNRAKNVAKTIYSQHRTLQQSMIGLMYQVLVEYGNFCEEFGTDLRNEQSASFAKKVKEMEQYFPLV